MALNESGFTRVIAPTLLALILVSNISCAGSPQPNSADGNSQQANPEQWQPGTSISGMLRRNLVGDPSQPGPFKYQLRIPGGARAAVHRHSKDVHVKVLSGSMFIIIGEPLESSRAQRFAAGSVFVVPAHAWHDEWWEEETVLEAEGVGPMETIYKSQVRIGNDVLDARRNMGNSNVQALLPNLFRESIRTGGLSNSSGMATRLQMEAAPTIVLNARAPGEDQR